MAKGFKSNKRAMTHEKNMIEYVLWCKENNPHENKRLIERTTWFQLTVEEHATFLKSPLLPDGVLAELKKKTPKDSKGRRVHRFHQLLTIDMGNPHLEKQLVAVMTLFRAASNWRVFEGLAARSFGKQKQLDFNDDEPEV